MISLGDIIEAHATLMRAAWWARRIYCPEGHRYAAYLPRCPFCVRGDGRGHRVAQESLRPRRGESI